MNAFDRPSEQDHVAPDGSDLGQVIPFPPGGRDGRNHSEVDWTFSTDIHWVDGADGAWLRKELADVVRALLVWASHDMNDVAEGNRGEERRAA